MEHVEYEERVLITESDYKKIIEDIKDMNLDYSSFDIENIYLDDKEGSIFDNRKMLRIRNISNAPQELTLKVKYPDGSCREINETLSNHPIIDKELNNRFSEFYEIARLITHRIEVKIEGYLLVVDKNEYSNIIDFDIEIEANSQQKAYEIIQKYCEKYHLKYDKNYYSKSHRAIKRAKELLKKKED